MLVDVHTHLDRYEEQLLTETDNPGAWEWAKGEVGMPRLIEDVYQTIAEVRGTTVEDMIRTVQTNFLRLIRNDTALSEITTMVLDHRSCQTYAR